MMHSENGVLIDLGEVGKVVDGADVFVVGFANFSERLLVDTRSDDETRPLVQMVEPLGSVQERIFWLGQNRPSLGMPQSFSFFNWPHSVLFLVDSGIWQRVLERVDANAEDEVEAHCQRALDQLKGLEHAAVQSAIRGNGHVTLWPRPAA